MMSAKRSKIPLWLIRIRTSFLVLFITPLGKTSRTALTVSRTIWIATILSRVITLSFSPLITMQTWSSLTARIWIILRIARTLLLQVTTKATAATVEAALRIIKSYRFGATQRNNLRIIFFSNCFCTRSTMPRSHRLSSCNKTVNQEMLGTKALTSLIIKLMEIVAFNQKANLLKRSAVKRKVSKIRHLPLWLEIWHHPSAEQKRTRASIILKLGFATTK